MDFTKVQGTGNDFVLVETSRDAFNWAKLAIAVCDRHFGIGGDGLLLVMPSKKADVRMRIFNADGSEAEACGNGLRCVVRYVLEKNLIKPGEASVETIVGVRPVKVTRIKNSVTIQVGMGNPAFVAEKIPVSVKPDRKLLDIKSLLSYPITVSKRELRLYFVSMGNPHAVYFTDKPVSEFPLAEIGPLIEHHEIFPKRTNFEVARVISRGLLEERTWERGVGETLACGSGISAMAVAANLLGLTDSKVEVRASGGLLSVEWDGKGEVMLGGPAEIVFTGVWPE